MKGQIRNNGRFVWADETGRPESLLDSLHKAGVTFDAETGVREMPKEYMSKMFSVMSARHSSEAKKKWMRSLSAAVKLTRYQEL